MNNAGRAQAGILIIEHSEKVRDNLKRILTGEGYRVHVADSADQALKVILEANGHGGKTDCIFIDLHLPDSTAMETVNFIRGHFPHIPLVGLWDSPDFGISGVLSEIGVRKFLLKSVGNDLLIKTLDSLLPGQSPSGT